MSCEILLNYFQKIRDTAEDTTIATMTVAEVDTAAEMTIAEVEVTVEMTVIVVTVVGTVMITLPAVVTDMLVMTDTVVEAMTTVAEELFTRTDTIEEIVVQVVMLHQSPPMVIQLLVEKAGSHMEVEAMMMIGSPVESIDC